MNKICLLCCLAVFVNLSLFVTYEIKDDNRSAIALFSVIAALAMVCSTYEEKK